MRRLKNIAEHLEAIFRKREQEQEKTLNLQSLEERVLYSASPIPMEMVDGMAEVPECPDVSEMAPQSAADSATSAMDQMDALLSDEVIPDPSTMSNDPLQEPGSFQIPEAGSVDSGSTIDVLEGDIVQILDTSLSINGLDSTNSGIELELSPTVPLVGGTLYQNGVEILAGDTISIDALQDGNTLLIPDVDFAGVIDVVIDVTDNGGDTTLPINFSIDIAVAGVPDDGVAVVGDSLTPIGSVDVITPPGTGGTDSAVVALEDQDGSYVVAYTATQPNQDDRIAVQRFNANGTPAGSSFSLNSGSGASNPEIAALNDGGFVVVFQDDVGGGADIRLQRFNSDGDPVNLEGDPDGGVDPELISRNNNTEQSAPSIVGTRDGGFAVVYQSEADDGQRNIVLSVFDADGNETGEIPIDGSTTGVEYQPEILELEDGRLLVTWVDPTDLGLQDTGDRLVGAILDPLGNTISDFTLAQNTRIATGGGYSIASTPNNGFVVALDAASGVSVLTTIVEFDEDGNEINRAQDSEINSNIENPEIAVLDGGTFVVGRHLAVDDGSTEVVFRRITEFKGDLFNPNVLQDVAAASTDLPGDQSDIEFAVLSNGRLVSVFESDGMIATQQSLQTVTTFETNPVDLQIAPLLNPTIFNASNIAPADTITGAVIEGLRPGTEILVDGISAGVISEFNNSVNISSQVANGFGSISFIAPQGEVGLFNGTLSVTTNHGGVAGDQTVVTDFGVLVTSNNLVDTIDVSGRVVHDRDIDGSIANDNGFQNVTVSLLEYVGNDQYRLIDRSDTDNTGRYKFTNLDEGRDYIVSVDASDVKLVQGDNSLAQQTYSSAGGIFGSDGQGNFSTTGTDGFLIGGANADRDNTFTTSQGDIGNLVVTVDESLQHGVFFTANALNVNLDSVDFGFNFDVVTHVGNDGTNVQGSFNQFLINANEIADENRLRFVPGEDLVPNGADPNGLQWWRIEVDGSNGLLESINDDRTIIDGTALRTNGSSGELVPYDLNPRVVNDLVRGPIAAVGVDADILGDDSQATITRLNAPDLEIVNTSGGLLEYGLEIRPTQQNINVEGVEIHNISIHGFGDRTTNSGNILVDGRGQGPGGVPGDVSDFKITGNVIGTAPDLSSRVDNENRGHNIVIFSASGTSESSPNEIRNNLILEAPRDGIHISNPEPTAPSRYLLIEDNVIFGNNDGVGLEENTSDISVVGN